MNKSKFKIILYLNVVDCMFNKFYRFANFVGGRVPVFSAVACLAVIFSLLIDSLLQILPFLKVKYEYNAFRLITICIIVLIVISIYYYKSKRYETVLDRYRNENKYSKVLSDVIFVIGIITYFVYIVSNK
jgi:hypothetical protein